MRVVRLLVLILVASIGLAATAVALVPPARQLASSTSSRPEDINLDPLAQRSLVYAADGTLLASLHAEENRSDVRLDQVPQVVIDTVLAVEDEDFYEHGGVNLRSTIRALFANVSSGGIEQGGSTITQQLVKNALLTPERDAERKLKEAVLAVRLEDEMTKDEILERYLNTVYFGNGAYGVQAAAETYFGVNVEQLLLPQAALLAGLIRNPAGYDPVQDPEGALGRRSEVLQRLVALGELTQREADYYDLAPLPDRVQQLLPPPDDYFVEEVKQQLLDDERLGETPQERYNAVFKGGLRIYTTFDPRLQAAALAARNSTVPPDAWLFTAAVASLDPRTGAVRAMVGGPGFERFKFNLATQGLRQTGSSFKTFALVAALEHGAIPDDTIDGSSPCRFEIPGQDDYVVRSHGGSGSLYRVTASSINCAFVRLGLAVGLNNVIDAAQRMGVSSRLDPVLSLPLGTMLVSPLDMASAYGVLADDGVRNEPYVVERVETADGDVVFEHEADPERVLDQDVARMATDVLQGVVTNGTGEGAALGNRQVAGKTGTTEDNADAWFVGYTPQLVTAVWMGAPGGRLPMTNLGGINVFGGTYPAEIFQKYMTAALDGQAELAFPEPPEPYREGTRLFVPDDECREDRFLALAEASGPPPTVPREGEVSPVATRFDDIARGSTRTWCSGADLANDDDAPDRTGDRPVVTGDSPGDTGDTGDTGSGTTPGGEGSTTVPTEPAPTTSTPPASQPPLPPTSVPITVAPPTTAPPSTTAPSTLPPISQVPIPIVPPGFSP
ncbi:MAG: transglycosylase domain-containing protein [Acidimicrobiales bacterium]|nr:transglycosylase domain-containing protein [Acidimicrobiales bacterium]